MAERCFTDKYDDIIHLPHHVSKKHPPMARADRAAQFAPYAALVGFGEVIEETSRITEEKAMPDEGEMERINRTLTYIIAHNGSVKAEFTYFKRDGRKGGGKHLKMAGFAVKIDEVKRTLIFSDGAVLQLEDIVDIVPV